MKDWCVKKTVTVSYTHLVVPGGGVAAGQRTGNGPVPPPGRQAVRRLRLYVLAVLCARYCVGIGLFVGFGSYFFLIWGVIAAFCAAWGWILTHKSMLYGKLNSGYSYLNASITSILAALFAG